MRRRRHAALGVLVSLLPGAHLRSAAGCRMGPARCRPG